MAPMDTATLTLIMAPARGDAGLLGRLQRQGSNRVNMSGPNWSEQETWQPLITPNALRRLPPGDAILLHGTTGRPGSSSVPATSSGSDGTWPTGGSEPPTRHSPRRPALGQPLLAPTIAAGGAQP